MARAQPRTRQLTRDDWIEAAAKVLVGSGIDDVKIDRLARRMKVTRGSFYWHFTDRDDLLAALLQRWERRNEETMDQIRRRLESGGEEPLVEAVRIWLTEDPALPTFDMAIRFWARKASTVAVLVRRIDESWIRLLQSVFDGEGVDPLESLARARIFYFHQIGYYALAMQESLEDRLRLAPWYHKVLVGQPGGGPLAQLVDDLAAGSSRARRHRAA